MTVIKNIQSGKTYFVYPNPDTKRTELYEDKLMFHDIHKGCHGTYTIVDKRQLNDKSKWRIVIK